MDAYAKEMTSRGTMEIMYFDSNRSSLQTFSFINGMIYALWATYKVDSMEKPLLEKRNLDLYNSHKNQDSDE